MAALILYGVVAWQNQSLVIERSSVAGLLRVPLVAMRPAHPAGPPNLKVLLIHGLSASKSAMLQMGSELARLGVDCFLIDLPGHGDSPTTFSRTAAGAAVEAVVAELLRNDSPGPGTDDPTSRVPRLVLIGHSFGAGVAIDAGQRDRRIAGVVALSPAAERVARDRPERLLVMLGEFDFPFVRRGAAFLFEEATGMRLPLLERPGVWANPGKNQRLVVLPWADHAQPLFRAEALWEIRAFLAELDPSIDNRAFSPWEFRARSWLRTLLSATLLLSWLPLFKLLSSSFRWRAHAGLSAEPARQPGGAASRLWIYGVAAGLGTFLLRVANPWDGLGLMAGGYLAGWLCLVGLAGILVCRPSLRAIGATWQALLYSLLGWAVLTVVCAPAATRHFVHLTLTTGRIWRFPWIFLSVIPFYLFDEYVCESHLQGLGRLRMLLFHLSSRLILLIGLLVGFFVLNSEQFLLVLILPGLLLMSILCWCLSRWVARHTGSIAASALFSALATAWFITVFFVQL